MAPFQALFLLFFITVAAYPAADKIGNLPGLQFSPDFDQYAGYLNYTNQQGQGNVHYWFMGALGDIGSAPLGLLLRGYPTCSSVFGLFEEYGPFRSYDGETLYENVFSLNKAANLLAIDKPGTGFSQPTTYTLDDESISTLLLSALHSFYVSFPEMLTRELYVYGHSYSSIYAAMVALKLEDEIINKQTAINFKGLILANAVLNNQLNYNAQFPIAYTHGLTGKDDWDLLRSVCCTNTSTINCDYSTGEPCTSIAQGTRNAWIVDSGLNAVNLYEDCYREDGDERLPKSTDPLNAYPCRVHLASSEYMTSSSVASALHANYGPARVTPCTSVNIAWYANEITPILQKVVRHPYNKNQILSTIIYNGDLDIYYNNFLGAQWFAQKFAAANKWTVTSDDLWFFNYDSSTYMDMEGGLATVYGSSMSVATVRGAGYYACIDRPSQCLQLFQCFLGKRSLSSGLQGISLAAKPLLPIPTMAPNPTNRKQTDKITNLPGLTFALNFNQYSGYLQASETHKIFYWLVECQSSASTAPLLVWFGGGPGIPGTWNLFTEHGPFRVNKDGQTLFENPYSWNKFANVLYIDSPIDTGFSYSTAGDHPYDDETTANDHYAALKDFLAVYPEYSTRSMYLTGASYAAIYIPMLTEKIFNGLTTGDINIALNGLIFNNGMFSAKHQANSAILQTYTYGLLGQREYDNLTANCCGLNDTTKCDFYSQYVTTDNHGKLVAQPNKQGWCADKIIEYVYNGVWFSQNDAYSIYQDCYDLHKENSQARKKRFVDYASQMSFGSTDALGGFPCFSDASSRSYLSRDDVRMTLHIPKEAPKWDTININMWFTGYNRSHFEMLNDFVDIINNPIYQTNKMRMLFYNGDTDLTSNHLGTQWFAEELAAVTNIQNPNTHYPWTYRQSTLYQPMVSGYYKSFYKGVTYATVKGSGQETGLDRAAPVAQLISNYVTRSSSLSNPVPFSTIPKPLLPQYKMAQQCSQDQSSQQQSTASQNTASFSRMNTDTSNLTAAAIKDMILDLPGLSFNVSFRNFAGYLHPTAFPLNHFFYWFAESQHDPMNDPVILWIDGGPGCSALGGLFKQMGPFHPNNDNGNSLFENVFSWNKKASVLYIESPADVGFSYTNDPNYVWNDDTTAQNNVESLLYFFTNLFPSLRKNALFVVGEGYGGIYAPTMVKELLRRIDAGNITLNLKGMAIGNGYLSHNLQDNSEVLVQYGRGINDIDDWNTVSSCCPNSSAIYCDYSSFPVDSDCYKNTQAILLERPTNGINGINMYDDCYMYQTPNNAKAQESFTDQNSDIWWSSTDPLRGFGCWVTANLRGYLDRNDVINAIHAQLNNDKRWSDCEPWPEDKYTMQPEYFDMSATFNGIMDSTFYSSNQMALLIFNGDIDTLCNFLGDQWFIEGLAQNRNLQVVSERQPWFFSKGAVFLDTVAGYAKRWTQNLHLLTVKGAGHLSPLDRPMQTLQMINNFIAGNANYSNPIDVDTTQKPLIPSYQTPVVNCTAKQLDFVYNLPGLLTPPTFNQYSGYLNGTGNHRLHYWLVECVFAASSAPLVLWLNGGPGQSSLLGLFEENGPYRVRKDGNIAQNTYSWNNFANVLYLESPVNVGFSYSTDNATQVYNDDNTAADNLAALQDFFLRFPEYKNRQFFITGESYAGVYVPTLTKLVLEAIQAGTIQCNLQGIAMGNGVLNKPAFVDTLYHLTYYHGTMSSTAYNEVLSACCQSVGDELNCPISNHVTSWIGDFNGNQSDPCFQQITLQTNSLLRNRFDPYNPYQQCFQIKNNASSPDTPIGETWTGIDYTSSDGNGGYVCFMDDVLQKYLNRDDVRTAIHVPAQVGQWTGTSDVYLSYNQQVSDTGPILKSIINSDYATRNSLRVLIYNGDADTACNWLAAETFTTDLFGNEMMLPTVSARQSWTYTADYASPIIVAGYVKRYAKQVDVITIKGAGHLTATDRPAITMQMAANWVSGTDYSGPNPYLTTKAVPSTSSPPPSTRTSTVPPPATTTRSSAVLGWTTAIVIVRVTSLLL